MEELDTREGHPSATPHASLAVIAVKLREMKLFEPIHREVKIAQKTVRYTPTDKLYQAFAGLLSGVCGIVEINERLRTDPALQQAFGLNGCAEQSVIQETLSEGSRESGRGDLPGAQSGISSRLCENVSDSGY